MAEHETEHVELDSRQEALERRVLLLCPTIGWWKGMYQLPNQSTETISEGQSVDKEDITTPRAKLMTDKYPVDRAGVPWKKRFTNIESRLSALKERYSVPFPIQGVRIVPKSRGQALMDEMYGLTIGRLRRRIKRYHDNGDTNMAYNTRRILDAALLQEGENAAANTPVYDHDKSPDGQSIAYDLHVAATEFCADWDDIRAQIAKQNAVFEKVASKVPTSSGLMRTKFNLDVVPVELAGGLTSAEEVTQDDLAEHNAVVKEACRRRVDEAIETMIAGPRQDLAATLANLQELINKDGRVSSKSFKPIRDAIAKIRMFDFVANPELLTQIGQLEDRLNLTNPRELDSITAANNGFSAAIAGFMAEVQDAEQHARDLEEFGRDFRSIDLD